MAYNLFEDYQAPEQGSNYNLFGDYTPKNQPKIPPVSEPVEQNTPVIEGMTNIARDIGRGVSKIPQGVVGFGKEIIQETGATAKNLWKQPSLALGIPSALGKGLVDGLIHDVTQGIVDIPEALAASYQNRPFQEQVHIPTTVDLTNSLAKVLKEKGIYSDEQYNKYQQLQKQGQERLDKLPIFKTAGQFMVPAAEVKGALASGGIGKAALHGAGFGALMPGDLENKVSNAGTGAVLGGGLGILSKGAPEVTKNVTAYIAKPLDKLLKSPTSFDSLKEIQKNIGDKVSQATIDFARLRNLKNDLNSYNALLDIQKSGEYSGKRLNQNQLKAVKRRIYNLEDSFKAQNDYINKNINDFDADTLNIVNSNLEGRYNATPVQDGYNVYGVPVEPSKIESFENKYNPQKSESRLNSITDENRVKLEEFKAKIQEINKQRAEQNSKALSDEEIKQMPEFQQLKFDLDVETKPNIENPPLPTKRDDLNTKDFNIGDFVKDKYDSNVYEVIETDKSGIGKLKNVDTGVISNWNAHGNPRFGKYEPDIKELLNVGEFEYNPKEKDAINAQNYVFSKQDVVEAYNEYIKTPTEKNAENYQDISGKYFEEYAQIKNGFKTNNSLDKNLDTLYPEHKDEMAITNWGKNKYDKTGVQSFQDPRISLETETQMLSRLKKRKKAEKAKDLENAKHYDTILKDGVHKWSAEIEKRRYDVNKDLNEFINYTRKLGKETGINDKAIREIMPFLRERTGIPEELNRPDLKDAWAKLDEKTKEHLTEMADNLSERFEKYWKEYKETHSDEAVDPTKSQIENYISHIWDLDNKQKSMMTNYFATRSRFAKERTIKTLFDGIKGIKMENGETVKLTPKTLDYAEILKTQSDSLIKATVDNAFANEVKSFKAGGVSLVMPFSKAPSDWVTINHPALNKSVIMPMDSVVGEVITPKLQNILAEMGVAIGRRINPRADFKGVYKHKLIQPEIALKRWFSNKTLAHEIGHAIDYNLGLQKSGFVKRHRAELLELNEERINALASAGKKSYAKSDAELVAELFGFLFNDPKMTAEIAPKATAEVLGLLSKNDTLKQLLPENFDWENAKHILEEKTVQMFKMPVKVHPDIADTLKTVFETPAELTPVEKFFDNTNAVLKQFQLGFSGFHIIALSEGGIANLGAKKTLQILNPVEMFNAVKNNEWDIYKKDEVVRQAIDDGLQIGATLDVHRNLVEGILEDAGLWFEKKIPVVGKGISLPFKFVSKLQKANNKILWDYFHNNYKLTTYEMLINQEKARGALTKTKRREIAQWVNDSYGGQVWENLGITPSGRRWEQRLFLSPDWLRSTTREALGMLSGEKTQKLLNNLDTNNKFWKIAKEEAKRWGIGSITDAVTASGLRGKTARKFFLNALVYMSLYTNIINAVFRAKDQQENPELYPKKMTAKDYSLLGNAKENKTYVFIGRNSDGTERYWRLGKKFREVPEMIEKPIEKIGGKSSPMVQLTSQTFTSKSVGGFENKDLKDKKGLERLPALGKVYAQSVLPFSLSPVVNPNKDLTVFDFFAPTGRGTNFYKGREEYMNLEEKLIKQKINQEEFEKQMNKINADLIRNQVDVGDVQKAAKKELRKKAYSKAFAKARKAK